MCGRYTLTETKEIYERFGVKDRLEKLEPSYNVAPGQFMPILVNEDGKHRMKLAKWGIIPFWAKDKPGMMLINAKTESITRPTWSRQFKSRRCLVPASGFFEWRKREQGKEPHYFYLKDRDLFAFAGLYDVIKTSDEYETLTYVIITTEPNKTLAEYHNRMPVILDKAEEEKWLDETTHPDDLLGILDPIEDSKMKVHAVTKEANSSRNNYPELIYPL